MSTVLVPGARNGLALGPALGDGPFMDLNAMSADGQVNWDDIIAGTYPYNGFSTSTLGSAAQYARRWWDRDFGEGGLFDVKMHHVTGFDVGIYSFRIDGREFARVDGWTGPDVLTDTIIATQVRVEPGRHRFEVRIDGANPAATGLKFYPAICGILFRRTAPLARGRRAIPGNPLGAPLAVGGQVIDVIPLMATGNTNWSNLAATGAMLHGYELYSTGAQNAARWWDLDLVAGLWDLELSCATFSAAGIYNIQIDGVTVATVDGYSASTTYRVKKTARIAVPSSGRHTLKLLMATKNGSASQYYGDISNVQLRQVAPGGRPLPHRIVSWICFWSSGQTNWTTFNGAAGTVYGGDLESTGAQNATIWWEKDLAAGTWDFELLHTTGSNRGIYTVLVDGQAVGTIDGYGGAAVNVQTILTGIRIPFSGTHKIGLLMATKNGSSSNYYGTITGVQMRRTD